MSAQHTPGPWRWELNEKCKSLQLAGGVPRYDLTVMDFDRWGMGGATVRMRDTAHDGMNILHKLHERRDWIAAYQGREHHADWHANAVHPDMRLIAAAPELLDALQRIADGQEMAGTFTHAETILRYQEIARAAIAKATGSAA